jgi:steroid delta-isomerase-like uncharacterized protein
MSADENRVLMRRFYEEVMNQGNLDFIDEFCAPEYVEHSPESPTPDRVGLKQELAMVRSAFPDIHIDIEDLVVEDDKVVARTIARGTNTGAFMGMPPTGKVVTIAGIDITQFVGGKAVEHWAIMDELGMMQQLGVIPAPNQHGTPVA